MTMGIASGLAVLTYLLNTLGGLVSGLKDYRFLSPFYHYMEPNTLGQRPLPSAYSGAVGVGNGILCLFHSGFYTP